MSNKPNKTSDRSAAISASWGNKKVAAARKQRTKVKVNGTEYRSVAAAFEELKLPMSRHIPFRMELKAAGRKVFEDEKGNKHTFTIVSEK